MAEDRLVFNGLHASGKYLTQLTPRQLADAALGQPQEDSEEKAHQRELKDLKRRSSGEKDKNLGVQEGVDPAKIDEAGWGVVFPAVKPGTTEQKEQAAIGEALKPLLDHRRAQAGELFYDFSGSGGLQPGESKRKFLARHGSGSGPVDPHKAPYYMLLVGDPEAIPFRVQYQLDVQHAVGRVHFDTVEEYANYARSVVEAEQKGLTLGRYAAFFGVAAQDDPATLGSSADLVDPLAAYVEQDQGDSGWQVKRFVQDRAFKSDLASLLGGDATPAFLFSASHGMGFDMDDPRMLPHQGALICQDWPGPRAWRKAINESLYFSGDDLASDACLHGLIGFFFACYGGGTPQYDDFSMQASREREAIASRAFVAGLPRRMLGHPRGGALAVVGHVERAWSSSFLGARNADGTRQQLSVFQSTLKRLLEGFPVGAAMEYFNGRYAELSSDLTMKIEDIKYGADYDAYEVAQMWTLNNDARSYAIIGDPAVRLMVGEGAEGIRREPLHLSPVHHVGVEQPAPVSEVEEAPEEDASAGYEFSTKDPPGEWAEVEKQLRAWCEEGRRLVGRAEESLNRERHQHTMKQAVTCRLEAIKAMLKALGQLPSSED